MRQIILVVLCAVILSHGGVLAAPATPSGTPEAALAAVEKLGALRARVANKHAELVTLTNLAGNGVNQAATAWATQYQQTIAALQKRAQQEGTKSLEARDQALIDSCTAKLEKYSTLWGVHVMKDAPAFNLAIGDIQYTVFQLGQIINTLTTVDQAWLRADLDAALLTTTLTAIDKRLDETTKAATPLIENFKKLCAERERSVQE